MVEFDKVIGRSKFRKYITVFQATRLRNFVLKLVRKAHVSSEPSIARDSCDNYLLGFCESCRARYLITGDEDLLILNKHKNAIILCMHEFLQILAR